MIKALSGLLIAIILFSFGCQSSQPETQVSPSPSFQAYTPKPSPSTPPELEAPKPEADLRDAIATNDLATIEKLLAAGVNPNSSKGYGNGFTILAYAAEFGSDKSVNLLVAKGGKWQVIPKEYLDDALIGASCNGYASTVQQLLKAGANPKATNRFSETPLKMAQSQTCQTLDKNGKLLPPGSRQHRQVVTLLEQAGAK